MSRAIFLLVLSLALLLGSPSLAAAQEASPAAGACVAPELPPGTPTPMEEMAGMAMGTPEAIAEAEAIADMAEGATPEMSAPAGTPADEAAAERVIAAAENLIACLNSGNALGFAALLTPNYLETEFETSNPYDLQLFLEGVPPFELRAATDVQTHDDGRLSVDITTVIGGTQIDRFRAYFVEGGEYLLLDEEVSLPVETADVTIEAKLLDFAFDLSETSVPAGSVVAFTLPNEGEYPHELAVVRLPEGATVEQVLSDPALEAEVQFLGGAFAEPGETGYFALQNLEPGTYTAVCFVDVPEGVPHVMRGMVAEFTVE
jgi:uncharacterized cupredoxin-like copper-binding protein